MSETPTNESAGDSNFEVGVAVEAFKDRIAAHVRKMTRAKAIAYLLDAAAVQLSAVYTMDARQRHLAQKAESAERATRTETANLLKKSGECAALEREVRDLHERLAQAERANGASSAHIDRLQNEVNRQNFTPESDQ